MFSVLFFLTFLSKKEDFIVQEWFKFFGERFFLELWTNDTIKKSLWTNDRNEWMKENMNERMNLLRIENFNFQGNLLKKLCLFVCYTSGFACGIFKSNLKRIFYFWKKYERRAFLYR